MAERTKEGRNRPTRMPFGEFAKIFGCAPDELYARMRTFNGNQKGHDQLSARALEKMRSEGVSQRNLQTRTWLRRFCELVRDERSEQSQEQIEIFLGQLGLNPVPVRAERAQNLIEGDPELFSFVSRMMSLQSQNAVLLDTRSDYSGCYRIIRRTSQRDQKYYYEEPFYLGDQGEESWLLPERQPLNRGFSFASNGICTSILIHPHRTRTLGIRVIMLYGRENPEAVLMPGVMLRFSDDQARPVASQILAKRVPFGDETAEWEDAFSELDHLERVGASREEFKVAEATMHNLVRRVTADDETAADFEIYSDLIQKEHAKAHDGASWQDLMQKYFSSDSPELDQD